MAVDEFTELVDGNIPRVDLVGKAANGTSFLIMKAAEDGEYASNRGLIEKRLVEELLKAADDPDLDAGGDVLVGTDDNTPGSPAWEQVDSDSAAKWVAILSRCKNAVKALKKREKSEGDDDACAQLWAACDAIDYAITCLAPYAAQEAADAAAPVFDGAALAKAAEAAIEPLSTIEAYVPLLKAGRVLSGANEGLLRQAADALTKVLSSLPAPISEGGVMKQETVEKSVEEQLAEAQAALAKAEAKIAKAKAKKVKKGALGKPVPTSEQADIDAGKFGAPLSDETGNHGPNPVDGVNALGYQVSAAQNTVPTPSDVKTLSGIASDQDDITGRDVMAGNAVVDTGVVSAAVPQGAPKDKSAGVKKAKGKKGKKAKAAATVVSDDPAVTKAGAQQAIYDSSGKLLGTVDPGKITQLVAEGGKDAAQAATAAPTDGGAAATQTSDDAVAGAAADAATAPASPADMAPVPSGAVGTPANDNGVAKSQDEIVQETLAKIRDEHSRVVKSLEARVTHLEAPAPSRVLSNGVLPPKEMLRGMDSGGGLAPAAFQKGEELREQFEKSQDVAERAELEKQMKEQASQVWADIVGRPTPVF